MSLSGYLSPPRSAAVFEITQAGKFTEDAVPKTGSLQMGTSGSPQTSAHTALAMWAIGEAQEALEMADH